jgi:hypothetical protein
MSNNKAPRKPLFDGVETTMIGLGILGVAFVGANKLLETETADRFFNSFDKVSVPEPYCVLKVNGSSPHIEIFARSKERNDHHGLDQVSTTLYSTDGKKTPLKEGMTGTFASTSGNQVYFLSKESRGDLKIDKYTSPTEYASVTITGWTQLGGKPGPVGTCSKVGFDHKVGPVWQNMPIRNWRAATPDNL